MRVKERTSDWERKATVDFRKELFLRWSDVGRNEGLSQKSRVPVHTRQLGKLRPVSFYLNPLSHLLIVMLVIQTYGFV